MQNADRSGLDDWEYDVARIRFALAVDGDVVETSYLDFIQVNELDNDTLGAIQALAIGERYAAGGGAASAWAITRVS